MNKRDFLKTIVAVAASLLGLKKAEAKPKTYQCVWSYAPYPRDATGKFTTQPPTGVVYYHPLPPYRFLAVSDGELSMMHGYYYFLVAKDKVPDGENLTDHLKHWEAVSEIKHLKTGDYYYILDPKDGRIGNGLCYYDGRPNMLVTVSQEDTRPELFTFETVNYSEEFLKARPQRRTT